MEGQEVHFLNIVVLAEKVQHETVFHVSAFGIEMPCIINNTEKVDISTLGVASEDKVNVHLPSKFTRNIKRIEPPLIC